MGCYMRNIEHDLEMDIEIACQTIEEEVYGNDIYKRTKG